ncbi:MAG: recombinase family protein [Candidatus Limnocylindrales bacterium]
MSRGRGEPAGSVSVVITDPPYTSVNRSGGEGAHLRRWFRGGFSWPQIGRLLASLRGGLRHQTEFVLVGLLPGSRTLQGVDLVTVPAVGPGTSGRYPTEKPEDLGRALAAMAGIAPGDVVLDPFCGSGALLVGAYERGASVLGCDIAPAALTRARGKLGVAPGTAGTRTAAAPVAARPISVLVHVQRPLDSGADASSTPPINDPLVRALAQLVRDRWAAEQLALLGRPGAVQRGGGEAMRRVPASEAELRGLRAARWIRESTPGQFDRYGPEAQTELQDRAIARLGLTDTGPVWRAAHSGRTVYRSAEMTAMLDAARRGEFDVLLVGYVSRWQRNLRQTLNLLEDALHPAGVAVYFADEEILSTCERHWDQLVEEAKDAERYSRRLSRRISEGYASKRATQRDPGGHPPYGFRRNEAKLLEPDPDRLTTVRRAFALSAAGETDPKVAAAVDLPLFTVRGVLTSPLCVGRLRDGSAAHWPPVVDEATWDRVQAARARRATNSGRSADPRRPYALSRLYCAACGTRLTGDAGYHRHRQVCAAFVAARPPQGPPRPRSLRGAHLPHGPLRAGRGGDPRRSLTRRLRLGRRGGAVVPSAPGPDSAALARIAREREQAMTRYLRDRDSAALDTTMRRLDADEARARQPREEDGVPAEVALRYLRELPVTWAKARGGSGRQLVADALFERIEVLGLRQATAHLSDHAVRHGLADVLPEEFGISVSGRGERARPDKPDRPRHCLPASLLRD